MSLRSQRAAVWTIALFAAAGVLLIAAHEAALAQTGPFGAIRQPAGAPPDGIFGWILAEQSRFYRMLSGLIRDTKADGSAVWGLLGISFLYGVFHAAGPGHGKAVISSYLVSNDETWRRGVVLSAAAALLQSIVAVAIVGVVAGLIGAASRGTVRWIEIASYALIALMGLRLTWVKGRSFVSALRAPSHDNHVHGKDHGSHQHEHLEDHRHHAECDHRHDHAAASAAGQAHARANDHAHAHHHDHHHDHHHGHDYHHHAGHAHGPEPQELAGPGGWQRGFSAILAVGLRPCSGAILVLSFALGQSLFWAGVASTFVMGVGTAITTAAIATLAVLAKGFAKRIVAHRDSGGAVVMRGIELLAAVLVLVFGVGLLTGYMVTERMF